MQSMRWSSLVDATRRWISHLPRHLLILSIITVLSGVNCELYQNYVLFFFPAPRIIKIPEIRDGNLTEIYGLYCQPVKLKLSWDMVIYLIFCHPSPLLNKHLLEDKNRSAKDLCQCAPQRLQRGVRFEFYITSTYLVSFSNQYASSCFTSDYCDSGTRQCPNSNETNFERWINIHRKTFYVAL